MGEAEVGQEQAQVRDESTWWRKLSLKAWAGIGAVGAIALTWSVNAAMPVVADWLADATGRPEIQVTVLARDEFDSEVENTLTQHFMWKHTAEDVPRPAAYAKGKSLESYKNLTEAYELGAVDVHHTLIRVQIASESSARVNINQIQLKVLSRSKPLRALWVDAGDLGGDVNVRYLQVNLDKGELMWTRGDGRPVDAPSFFVKGGETETIDVLALANQGYYEWRLVVSYTTENGERGKASIKPGWSPGFLRTGSVQNAAYFSLGTSCRESRVPGPRLCGRWPPPPGPQPAWTREQ
jgi:hypothetical protein